MGGGCTSGLIMYAGEARFFFFALVVRWERYFMGDALLIGSGTV